MAVEGEETVGDPTKFELTETEIAILQGNDPENPVDEPEDEIEDEAVVDVLAEEDDPAEDEPEDDELPEHWATSADRQLAEVYGLTDDDLLGVASREEFTRTIAMLARRAKTAPPAEESAEEETPEEEDASEPVDSKGRVNVAYYKANDYDEGYVKAMESLRKSQDEQEASNSYLRQLQEQAEQAEQNRLINDFMDVADELRPEFYGKSLNDKGEPVKLSKEHAQRRHELYQATQAVANYYTSKGQRPPGLKELTRKAEIFAFGDQIKAMDSEKRTEAARRQSVRRRPVASSAGAKAARKQLPESDDPAAIASDPDVVAAWEKGQG